MSITDVKKHIGVERAAIEAKIKKIRQEAEEKVKRLEKEAAHLNEAFAVLNGHPVGETAAGKKRVRKFRGRVPMEQRKREVYDYMRTATARHWTSADIHKEKGWPQASVQNAVAELIAEKKAIVVERTKRGKPIVRYVAQTIRPGEEVKA